MNKTIIKVLLLLVVMFVAVIGKLVTSGEWLTLAVIFGLISVVLWMLHFANKSRK
jgi:hypothetical protein